MSDDIENGIKLLGSILNIIFFIVFFCVFWNDTVGEVPVAGIFFIFLFTIIIPEAIFVIAVIIIASLWG